jgi:hypothetical protein
MDYEFLDDGIFALRGFLTAEECADHIANAFRGPVFVDSRRETGHGNIDANDPKRTFCLLRLAQFSKSLRTA